MKAAQELVRAADKHGLVVQERAAGHFQILGGVVLVNYYPESRRRSAYIAGMQAAHHYVTPAQAVALAMQPVGIPMKTERRKSYAKIKRRLYRKSDQCFRCKRPILEFAQATLEHIIPLSQGGLDNANNMALSHERCNHAHGNKMPEGRR